MAGRVTTDEPPPGFHRAAAGASPVKIAPRAPGRAAAAPSASHRPRDDMPAPDSPAAWPAPATYPVAVPVGGTRTNARLHLAGGPAPGPAVLLLHAFPGPWDLGLAAALCAAGAHVLAPHYRGTWGGGGTFSWAHAEADARAALALLREHAAEWRVDPARVAVVGHSVGGWVALRLAAADPRVAAVAALGGTNLGRLGRLAREDPAVRAAMRDAVRAVSDAEAGPVRVADADALAEDVVAHADDYDLARAAAALRDRPVLLVGAADDREAPVALHHGPLAHAFAEAGAGRLAHAVLPADHAFTAAGPALHALVLGWARRELGLGGAGDAA